jgi:hypothetical protein
MKMPASLQNLMMPPARIAEVAGFDGFHTTQRIEDAVRQVALHETGHAVAWALNGGTLVRTTMIPVGDRPWRMFPVVCILLFTILAICQEC